MPILGEPTAMHILVCDGCHSLQDLHLGFPDVLELQARTSTPFGDVLAPVVLY